METAISPMASGISATLEALLQGLEAAARVAPRVGDLLAAEARARPSQLRCRAGQPHLGQQRPHREWEAPAKICDGQRRCYVCHLMRDKHGIWLVAHGRELLPEVAQGTTQAPRAQAQLVDASAQERQRAPEQPSRQAAAARP